MKKQPREYPYVSIETTQAQGSYEVAVQVAENIFQSFFIDDNNLNWIEKEIAIIRKNQKTSGQRPQTI